ncbi:protein of unknown function DUF214 [Shewanella halifaxensis HAW-EB4]|uniref:Permease n=1 Tax=Shewanella halifaxensis (strain HAW-EB4) TaxID=458817 RepID=B0TQF0_SHEHH|nr:ABC transporter permease [Shewanella halifaxensis]ABZ78830.1 protein of unknown function DUF214 [Shewanella halifaxensis HAW-EB4]
MIALSHMLTAAQRQFGRAKQYYLTVTLSLALTLSLVFSVFSILDVAYLQPLPYGEADELYYVEGTLNYQQQIVVGTNTQNLLTLQQQQNIFSDLAIYFSWSEYKLLDSPERPDVPVMLASHNLFEVLQLKPVLGRFFNVDETMGNKQPSAILSYQAWQQHFAADPSIIGKSVQLNQRRFTIIGVTPDNLVLPQRSDVAQAIWLPLDMDEQLDPKSFGGYGSAIKALGRLQTGVTPELASERLGEQMLAAAKLNTPELVKEYELSGRLQDFTAAMRGDSGKLIVMLVGGVSLLTLMALINLGNLQLARAVGRVQTVAISYAFGATRKQLFKDIFRHNGLLIGLASLFALLLTSFAFNMIGYLGEELLPRLDALSLNANMLLFAVLVTLVIAFVFSWIELKAIDESQLQSCLQASGKGTGKQLSKGVSHGLIGLQLLFAVLTLVASSQVLMASLNEALRQNHIISKDLWSMVVNYGAISDKEARVNLQRAVSEHLRAQSGVVSVSRASDTRVPDTFNIGPIYNEMGDNIANGRVTVMDDNQLPLFGMQIQGRFFSREDLQLEYKPVIINQRLAAKFDGDAIGQKVMKHDKVPMEIVGVVSNTDFPGSASYEADELFIPGNYSGYRVDTLVIKVKEDHAGFNQALMYAQLLKLDPRLDIMLLKSVDEHFANISRNQRFSAWLAGGISLVSLIMVLAGINGMISYMVRMRRYELGVRLAMGASQKLLLRSQLFELAKPMATAALFGFSISYFVIGYSRTQVDWRFALYWPELISSLALLLVFAVIVSFIPIWRILKTDPIKALRNE